MRDVRWLASRHVTDRTILLFRMVSVCHFGVSVARQTFLAEVADTLLCTGRAMRIVACGTRQLVTTRNLTCTAQERLILTASPPATGLRTRLHKVHCVVREIVSRAELCERCAGTVDSNISFKMTLETDTISPARSQFGWVHDRTVSLPRQML